MRAKSGLSYILIAPVLLLLVVACGSSKATPIATEAPPTPDAQATITALAERPEVGTPTPTPVDPEERAVALEFVNSHGAITRSWDKFHGDFDTWRESLPECNASSLRARLRGFASDFSGITEEARALPRSSGVRELSDKLIGAIEGQETAIRQLRDTWQPDDPTVFELVDTERSAALTIQNEVRDSHSDLQDITSPSSRLLLVSYSVAVDELNLRWDEFHRKFDSLISQEEDLSSSETLGLLSQLVDDLRDIVTGIRNLPALKLTRPVSLILAEAAEAEDLALRKLRSGSQKSESAPELPDETSPPAPGDVAFTPLDATLVDAFNAQIVESNKGRRQAAQALADLITQSSPQNQAAVKEFAEAFYLLLRSWNGFHGGYDDWLRTEGGCDRSAAITKLGAFTLQFEKLVSEVRELPRATFLRPLGELLIEAGEREGQALRLLRNAWRPFDADVYTAFDRERASAGKLRRQVVGGTHDLLSRYDISGTELAP